MGEITKVRNKRRERSVSGREKACKRGQHATSIVRALSHNVTEKQLFMTRDQKLKYRLTYSLSGDTLKVGERAAPRKPSPAD
jgi:hypothetical protein